ncbi:hypothetical protein FSARC_11970, partial [Fusarium sarcochroum]
MSPASEEDELNGIEPGKTEDTEPEGEAESKAGDDSSEEDSDSDEEELREKVSVKALLDEVLGKIRSGKLDLTDENQHAHFITHDGQELASQTGDQDQPTVLHIMASRDKKELPKFDSKMQPLIEFLSKQQDYLTTKNRSGHTSLFLAIEAKKKEMVQWMCDVHPDISSVLAIAGSRNMNCLHAGINKRVRFLGLLIDKASPEALAAKDDDGNTPLHLAVEHKKCKREQLDFIKQMVEKGDPAILAGGPGNDFNKDDLSPYLYHKESVRKAQEKEKKKAKEEADREKASSRYQNPGMADKPNKDMGPIQRGGISSSGGPAVHSSDPANRADRRPNTQLDHRTKYGGGNPIQAPVAASSPMVATTPDLGLDEKKRSAREPESTRSSKKEESSKFSSKVDEAIVKNVEHFLKLHYLRSRSYDDAMEILYGRNTTTDQELYFDLSGNINTGVVTLSGLENLLSKLKFEDTLQYVCIPKISVQISRPTERNGASRRSAKAKPDGTGKRDLCYIFDRLRKKGVKTILRVFIDDSDSPSHSDEAIEDALKTMGVEVWDWNKTDLCTEVIYKAAPNAREVHLYWSGNNAVLRGWSEEGGLKKLRELKKVHIHIQQGLESSARTRLNVKEFENRMERLYSQVRVDPIWSDVRQRPAEANAARNEEQTEYSTKHEWIQCMKDFRRLLFDAEKYYEGQKISESIEEPIKVALIDDGVDVKDLEYTFIGGRTFCPRVEHHDLNDPYYVSRSGHGTIMAKQIHLMCPQAQFYVLRLEDCPSEDAATLNITAKSAAKAIRAAILKKVHIISMSWTIDPPEDEEERRELESAVIDAANADILMFCSAMDKGAKQTATYPSKATPNKIFTIGAANASGASVDYVGNLTNINYTFPGDKVEIDGGPTKTTSQEIVDGSSVATALAAGLAALILYCVQVRVLLASDHDKLKARRDFQAIKKHEGMKQAFRAIETTEESNHKFLKVWEVFGRHVEQRERVDQEKWIG